MKILLGGVATEASGSLGGITASHNRAGSYLRARKTPVNPNTVPQQLVRAAMSLLSSAWAETLTQVQRDAWDTYAELVQLPGPLGNPRNVGGVGMYQRANVGRIASQDAGLPIVDDAPTIYNLGEFTAPTIASVTASTDILSLVFDNLDDWANADEAAMLIYASRGQNESVNYFKGPYQLAAVILGDSTTPPTSPEAIALPFPIAVGQKCFIRAVVSREDGRLSSSFRDFGLGI